MGLEDRLKAYQAEQAAKQEAETESALSAMRANVNAKKTIASVEQQEREKTLREFTPVLDAIRAGEQLNVVSELWKKGIIKYPTPFTDQAYLVADSQRSIEEVILEQSAKSAKLFKKRRLDLDIHDTPISGGGVEIALDYVPTPRFRGQNSGASSNAIYSALYSVRNSIDHTYVPNEILPRATHLVIGIAVFKYEKFSGHPMVMPFHAKGEGTSVKNHICSYDNNRPLFDGRREWDSLYWFEPIPYSRDNASETKSMLEDCLFIFATDPRFITPDRVID